MQQNQSDAGESPFKEHRKEKEKNWNESLTFPVHSTPFQIEKYTRTQASARVPTKGQRSSPGSSKPLDSWCMLRLQEHTYTLNSDTDKHK